MAVGASLIVLLGLCAYVILAALGNANRSESRSAQSCLREMVSEAPGDTYWLGSDFRGAAVDSACTYGDFGVVDYRVYGDGGADGLWIHVYTVTGGTGMPYKLRNVHTVVKHAGFEDVFLVFVEPKHPSAELVRQARVALRPIPLNNATLPN